MKSMKTISIMVLVLVCSGCVSLPSTPAFDVTTGAKIGYEIDLKETISHTHYGTTVLNNFAKEREAANWGLNEYAKSEANRLLKSYGYVPVEINQEMIDSIGIAKSDSYEEALRLEAEYRKGLSVRYDLQAVIRLVSYENTVHSECGSFGCAEFAAANPGFFSRGLALLKPFLYAVLPSITHAYLTDPSIDIHTYSKSYAVSDSQLLRLNDFSPDDFKNMTESDWEVVENKVKELITLKLKNKIMAIRAGSDGSGGVIRQVE